MIYLDPMTLGPKSLLNAWLKYKIPKYLIKSQVQTVIQLFDWLIEPCLDFITKNCDKFIECSQMHLTMSFLKLFECLLDEMRSSFSIYNYKSKS
jgi:dynein heavy chain